MAGLLDFFGGSGGGGLLGMSSIYGDDIQRDANGNPLPREQHNRAIGEVLGGIGNIFTPIGGMLFSAGGNALGNMIAGKNAFTGRGDFWSNFDPTNANGPIAGPFGAYSPLGSMGGSGMTSNMAGGWGALLRNFNQ